MVLVIKDLTVEEREFLVGSELFTQSEMEEQ